MGSLFDPAACLIQPAPPEIIIPPAIIIPQSKKLPPSASTVSIGNLVIPKGRDRGVQLLVDHLEAHSDKYIREGAWDQMGPDERFQTLDKGEREAVLEQARFCRRDFIYAARQFFWITNDQGHDQLFTLWESQWLVLQKWMELKKKERAQKIMILKGRQLGCSLLIEAMIAWRTMFFRNTEAIVVSVDEEQSSYLYGLMLHFFDKMPWWLKPEAATLEVKGGLHFDRKDREQRQRNPGMNSHIYVQHANQLSGVGQGKRLSAAHVSEYSDFQQAKAKEIIEGDLLHSIHDNDPNSFGFLESTGRGSGSYSHMLWKANIKMGEDAEWYPLFLPFFLERSRVVAPPQGWHIDKPERMLRDRVMSEWVKCDECAQYHVAKFGGESRIGTTCPACDKGTLKPAVLSDEQLRWKELKRKNAEAKDKESLKLHHQETACVVGSTRISTPQGIVRIEMASGVTSVETGHVREWIPRGRRQVIRLTTKIGRELVCTPEHLIRVEGGEWLEAEKLIPGDVIQLTPPMFAEEPYTVEWSHTPTVKMSIPIGESWARLLGYIMGDGCWIKNGFSIFCDAKDPDVAEDVRRLFVETMGKEPLVYTEGNMIVVRSVDARWFEIAEHLGCIEPWDSCTGYHRKVRVPDCVWRSPKKVVAEFIRTLFECDGHAHMKNPRVRFFTKWEQFARDIQLLLLGFGINCSSKRSSKTLSTNGKTYYGNMVELNANAAHLYYSQIGFVGKRKSSGCSRPPIRKHCQIIDENRMLDIIASVSDAGEEEVFDLSMEAPHYFGANGISVHNCTAEDGWQLSGYAVFDEACQDAMALTVRNPMTSPDVKVGFIDSKGRFHGVKFDRGRDGSKQLKIGCFVDGCQADHRTSQLCEDESTFIQWEAPIPGREYSVGVDIAEGIGEDYSVIAVNKLGKAGTPDEQVAVWRSNDVEPLDLAFYANTIGRMYNEALMCIEYNFYKSVADAVRGQYQYPNLFRWKHLDSKDPMSNKFHWMTQPNTKPKLWQQGRKWIKAGWFIVRSPNFVEESQTFQKDDEDDKKAEHAKGCHDDELLAVLIALYCAHEWEADESGRINPGVAIAEVEPPRYKMICKKCGCEWGAARPDTEYRCPKEDCGSIFLIGVPLEAPDPRAKLDLDALLGVKTGEKGESLVPYKGYDSRVIQHTHPEGLRGNGRPDPGESREFFWGK